MLFRSLLVVLLSLAILVRLVVELLIARNRQAVLLVVVVLDVRIDGVLVLLLLLLSVDLLLLVVVLGVLVDLTTSGLLGGLLGGDVDGLGSATLGSELALRSVDLGEFGGFGDGLVDCDRASQYDIWDLK